MATLIQRMEIELDGEELVSLPDIRGRRLTVVEGRLWLTLDHDLRDIFLGAGDSFTVDRDGVTLLHALAPTRLRIDSCRDAAPHASWRRWLAAVLRRGQRLLAGASPSRLAGA